jgi:hypothetical protein
MSASADIFKARAEARALLFAAGELHLHDAVDVLQQAAVDSGLVDVLGQDQVQSMLSAAFGAIR